MNYVWSSFYGICWRDVCYRPSNPAIYQGQIQVISLLANFRSHCLLLLFVQQVREEMLAARVKGLMCNGLSEVAARQEVERSMPIDKSSYMLQAMVVSSLLGG